MIRASFLTGGGLGLSVISALNADAVFAVVFFAIFVVALLMWRGEVQREAV